MTEFSREHDDPHAVGDPLSVDRQRVIHSAAFRRLEYKTQVFVALEGDHYRTRLTHTLEVANLARVLAGRLGLNAELAECAALAHDLGHPPFGHAGERALDACLGESGGFEHNAHSLRVVEYLEHPYPEFRGLNLTRAVRGCLAKHATKFDKPGSHPLQDGKPPSGEGRVAALADRLAYGLHDLQDGLHAGLLDARALSELTLWRECYAGPSPGESGAWRGHLRPAMDRIQRALMDDVVGQAADTRETIGLSKTRDGQLGELESFLMQNLYRNSRLVRMDSKARRIIQAVFDAYVCEPRLMPKRYFDRVEQQGAARVAADYIAGMTDRFCLDEHARLFDPKMSP